MSDSSPITVESTIRAPIDRVWSDWKSPDDITPDDIKRWKAASSDWYSTSAQVDLREGGAFSSRMEARDGSAGFDFGGTYARVTPNERLEYAMEDGRVVSVAFIDNADDSITVRETFDAEGSHSRDEQQQGWQAILDNFKRHVEGGE